MDAVADDVLDAELEIHVHHARNIHNICIYDNQDVYAKFSLTCNPDEALSTRVINGGGKNPEFKQDLMLKITGLDAVLKCEIWMLSRARKLMEDQLLGFALVPVSQVVGKGKITHDYTLSSTDLFHSPAGTVRLTLSLNKPVPVRIESAAKSSISSEVVLLDRPTSQDVEYSRIEFPDINVARENQKMVSEYLSSKRPGLASFLHLAADTGTCSVSDDSSLSDCVGKGREGSEKAVFSGDVDAMAMQQQIVEMYMRSMQQFSESLAHMKLPMGVDKQDQLDEDCDKLEEEKKKKEASRSRVFYGSRAFF